MCFRLVLLVLSSWNIIYSCGIMFSSHGYSSSSSNFFFYADEMMVCCAVMLSMFMVLSLEQGGGTGFRTVARKIAFFME